MALDGGGIEPGTIGIVGSDKGQQALSIIFLLIALICVPIMLVPKPLYIEK